VIHHCSEPGCRSNEDDATTETKAEPVPWRPGPLSIALTTRDDVTFYFDGRASGPKPDLASLDDVDKAALRVLLQQVLREMQPAPPSHTFSPSGIVPSGYIAPSDVISRLAQT
jgi:hypothetical protein